MEEKAAEMYPDNSGRNEFHQRIIGKTKQDRETNYKIRHELGQFSIEVRLNIKHLEWFWKCDMNERG